jgi:hypothetical protein
MEDSPDKVDLDINWRLRPEGLSVFFEIHVGSEITGIGHRHFQIPEVTLLSSTFIEGDAQASEQEQRLLRRCVNILAGWVESIPEKVSARQSENVDLP